jgi:hypothetical protein
MRLLQLLILISCKTAYAQFTVQSFSAAQISRNQVVLDWVVGPGNTCADLLLEMSKDSVNYTVVYDYPGICGDVTFSQSYQYIHQSEECNGKRYYRLISGSGVTYAQTELNFVCYGANGITLTYDHDLSAVLINADIPSGEKWEFSLYTLQGTNVLSQELTKGSNRIVWNTALAGIYIYTVMSGQRRVIFDQLLIVR